MPCVVVLLLAQVGDGANEIKARAKDMIARGTKAFDRKEYEEAARQFLGAYDLLESKGAAKAELLHNAAVAYERLGDCEKSAPLFARYLASSRHASADVVKRLQRAAECAPPVSIETTPAGANVIVDGRVRGRAPLSLHLRTGEHHVAFELEGYERIEETIRVATAVQISRALVPLPPPPPPPPPATPLVVEKPIAEEPSFSPSAWFWVSGGAGVAALIAGIVLGVLASNEHDLYEAELAKPDDCDCRHLARGAEQDGRRLALGANLSYGAAAIGLAAAGLLFFLDP